MPSTKNTLRQPASRVAACSKTWAGEQHGASADPEQFWEDYAPELAAALPKTRSGKILRRFLKANEPSQDAGDVPSTEG